MVSNLFDRIASAAAIGAKFARLRAGDPVIFEQVTEAAQPLLAALIARQVDKSIWVLCANVRAQEAMHNEISNWFPDAFFFPESERLPSDAGIPV